MIKYRRTLTCPACGREFTPDAEHRYNGACCAMCAKALTPHPSPVRGPARRPDLALTVIAPRVNRKHGADRRNE